MMEQKRWYTTWPVLAVLIAASAALGFGVACWTAPKNIPATASVVANTVQADNSTQEIKIPVEYLAAAKIAVEAVTNGGMEAEILAAGTVTSPPNGEAIVVARASGNISRINRQLGDKVRAGEALAYVDSMEAASMSADMTVAAAKAELARKAFARESSLFQQGVTPR